MTKKLHYLTSSTGLFAIFASYNNGGGTMHYTLKDHQGNLTATIHGNTVERLSYDAWGRRRNPVGFGYSNVTHTFDRGYTLHEHYDDFDLINMNGRLYDPVLGRMLSPDIAIQDEHNAQAYNRYSYCFNNPLRFTDPSGYVVEDYWDPFTKYRPDLIEVTIDEKTGRLATGIAYDTKESQGMERFLPFTYKFGEGNPNADDVLNSKTGACLEASLGEICARLGFPYSLDDANKWHEKSLDYHEYLVGKYQDKIKSKEIDENRLYGNNPKYTQDYIEWTNNGKYNSYKATRFNEVWLIPDAYEERSQVLIAVDLKYMEGHAGVINSYSHDVVERFAIGDPSPVRLFLKQIISLPPHYTKPYKGNATFFKIKGL